MAKWVFKSYGLRWKYMIYKKMKALRFSLLLDAGYNYLNNYYLMKLTNFIYYKISKVISILLMSTRMKWKILKETIGNLTPIKLKKMTIAHIAIALKNQNILNIVTILNFAVYKNSLL